MNNLQLFWILVIAPLSGQAQDMSYEQKAFSYFASELAVKNYTSKKIFFIGQTENEKSIAGPFAQCFASDDFNVLYYQQKKTESEILTIAANDYAQFKKSKEIKNNQLNLKVYRSVVIGDFVYVYIKVYKI